MHSIRKVALMGASEIEAMRYAESLRGIDAGIEAFQTNDSVCDADALIIVRGTDERAEAVISSLKLGRAVLCMDQQTFSYSALERIIDVAKTHGRFEFGCAERFRRDSLLLKKRKAELGNVYYARAQALLHGSNTPTTVLARQALDLALWLLGEADVRCVTASERVQSDGTRCICGMIQTSSGATLVADVSANSLLEYEKPVVVTLCGVEGGATQVCENGVYKLVLNTAMNDALVTEVPIWREDEACCPLRSLLENWVSGLSHAMDAFEKQECTLAAVALQEAMQKSAISGKTIDMPGR